MHTVYSYVILCPDLRAEILTVFMTEEVYQYRGIHTELLKKTMANVLGEGFFYLLDYVTPIKNFQIGDHKKNLCGHSIIVRQCLKIIIFQ